MQETPETVQTIPQISKQESSSVKDKEKQVITKSNRSTDSQLLEIGVNQIVPNPYQPRKTIDPESLKELAASIEAEGLLLSLIHI